MPDACPVVVGVCVDVIVPRVVGVQADLRRHGEGRLAAERAEETERHGVRSVTVVFVHVLYPLVVPVVVRYRRISGQKSPGRQLRAVHHRAVELRKTRGIEVDIGQKIVEEPREGDVERADAQRVVRLSPAEKRPGENREKKDGNDGGSHSAAPKEGGPPLRYHERRDLSKPRPTPCQSAQRSLFLA